MRGLRTSAVVAGVAAVALALSACGSKSNGGGNTSAAAGGSSAAVSPSAATTASASAPVATASSSSTGGSGALKACMVLDTGGLNDKSFNESSYGGMTAANKANPKISISYVPSNSGNDYTPNLTAEVNKGCQAIIAVGGLMEDNVKAIAAKNPSKHFAEVDAPSTGKNVYGLQFNTAQAAFLGGYLAAGVSKTHRVATWGGLPIGPVTIYMDGFYDGVQYYNKMNHANVSVLGWNTGDQKGGTFVNEGNSSFNDQNKGKQISQTFINQGADVIFPVAGGSGVGALTAAQAGGAHVIWVDTDGCVSLPQYCKYMITSVTKGLGTSVQTYLQKVSSGTFPTGSYVGTLANNGVGLAPFHDYASNVSSSLQSQLKQVQAGIESGSIKVVSPSQPK